MRRLRHPPIPPRANLPEQQGQFRYTGEQWDPNSQFYYLRARCMSPEMGRFVSPDNIAGMVDRPLMMHRYLYGEANPNANSDPSGQFSQSFGYAVEDALEPYYAADHPGHVVWYGRWCRMGARPCLKPDILNHTAGVFNEIKPLSPSGIGKGIFQLGLYQALFLDEGYSPDITWVPPAALVVTDPRSGRPVPTWFRNVGGIVFYTDIEDAFKEMLVITTAYALYHVISKYRAMYTLVDEAAKVRGLIDLAMKSRWLQIRQVQSQPVFLVP